MLDASLGAVVALILVIVHIMGVVLGFWLRHQFVAAHIPKSNEPQKDEKLVPSEAEQAAAQRRAMALLNEKMKRMGLPVIED